MSSSRIIIRQHPGTVLVDAEVLAEAVDATLGCVQACTTCADACLGEPDGTADGTLDCVRRCQDCAQVCGTTATLLARAMSVDPVLLRRQLEACVAACRAGAEECERLAGVHAHCGTCAEACRTGEAACRRLLGYLGVVR